MILPHKFTHTSQTHKIWLISALSMISGAHSSKADGVVVSVPDPHTHGFKGLIARVVTILPYIFINLHLC